MSLNLPDFFNRPVRFPSIWNFFDEEISQDILNRSVRIYEENDQLHVEIPLPGLKLDDIEVNLNQGILMVKGESTEEEKDKNRKYYRSSNRNYSYSVALPAKIDENQEPQAIYKNGVLNIRLQMLTQEKAKKITVKDGNS